VKFLVLVLALVVITITALAQSDPADPPGTFVQKFPSVVLLIPLYLGMLGHWIKGFTRGTIPVNWWVWLTDNIGLTIGAMIAAIVQLVGFYQLTPGILDAGGASAWWIVFLMGYGADSLMNSNGKLIK